MLKLHTIQCRSRGFTLLELLVALTISAIIMAATISSLVMSVQGSRKTTDFSRLDSQLKLVISAMTLDIQRAGYWGNAGSKATNPFMAAGVNIAVNASNDCILLSYDRNADGLLPIESAVSDDERYGYRWVTNVIQYRPATAAFNCTSANWVNLTDPNVIQVTAFSVTLNTQDVDIDGAGVGTENMRVRSISLSISAQLTSDVTISKTTTQEIKVYNDEYVP